MAQRSILVDRAAAIRAGATVLLRHPEAIEADRYRRVLTTLGAAAEDLWLQIDRDDPSTLAQDSPIDLDEQLAVRCSCL